jgi:hypothetical protein
MVARLITLNNPYSFDSNHLNTTARSYYAWMTGHPEVLE